MSTNTEPRLDNIEPRVAEFPQAGTGGYTWHLLKTHDWEAICGVRDDDGKERFTSSQVRVNCPKCLKIINKE